MGVLFAPLRTRAAHIVQLGSIGIENRVLQSAPNLDRRHQIGRREDKVSGQFGGAEIRSYGAAHDDYPIWSFGRSSLVNFQRNQPSEQISDLSWQRLCQDWTVAGFQSTTDFGQ
jgi:hypothetical protein